MPPQDYEVVVRGRMGPELAEALKGFAIETGAEGITRIVGRRTDQSRLLGLLQTLDDLHIDVLSVTSRDVTDSPESAQR